MKNSEEMLNSLFERRAVYCEKQNRRKKAMARAAVSVGCFCLVAAVGFGLWQGKPDTAAQPEKTSESAAASSTAKAKSADKIVIQKVDGFSGDGRKLAGELNEKDFVAMDKASLTAYYGTNVFPEVPDDLKEWDDEENSNGIYRENGGTGKVYYDTSILNYSNDDFSRSVNIEAAKSALPVNDCAFFSEVKEKSVINKTEVAIGKDDDGYYYAQFMFCGVGFRIITEGLAEKEVVSVISSLTK